jgi:hypothetical protein
MGDSAEGLRGTRQTGPLGAQRLVIPTGLHYVVDVSGVPGDDNAYVDIPSAYQDCRCVYVDVTGIIKIQYKDPVDGELHIEVMDIGTSMKPISCVTRVYKNYKSGSACTAQVFKDDGNLVVGLKLRK